jgi:hypothetical protein
MKRIHIDDLERIPMPDGIFRPIRRPLGVTAFGANAFTADNPGDSLIESHDERSTGAAGHEELYVVLTGRAAFVVEGEAVDAPAGTLVLVPVGERRSATAAEPHTTVLIVGGTPGAAGPVTPFEYWYAAQPAYDAGDYARAYEIASAGLAEHPHQGTLHYQLACFAALAGDPEMARRHLAIAFANEPRARGWAATDTDLDGVRPL